MKYRYIASGLPLNQWHNILREQNLLPTIDRGWLTQEQYNKYIKERKNRKKDR